MPFSQTPPLPHTHSLPSVGGWNGRKNKRKNIFLDLDEKDVENTRDSVFKKCQQATFREEEKNADGHIVSRIS